MEELSLFDFNTETDETKENKKTEPSFLKKSSLLDKKELYREFPLTMPSKEIKDSIIDMYLREGLKKREINKILKGLFFKEKIFNTKLQAMQFLEKIDHTYAVKYKIGIEPSPKLVSLSEKLEKKKLILDKYKKEMQKKLQVAFITCKNCKSRLNTDFIEEYICPLCNIDLRNENLLKKLQKTESDVKNMKDRLEFETRKYNSHFTGGEKWILRILNNLEKSK